MLAALEMDGYRFDLAGGDPNVTAAAELLNPAALAQLRMHKRDLLLEYHERSFVTLVRVTGACEHGLMIDDDDIRAALDDDDIECLTHLDSTDRRLWADMLAYRLCAQRLKDGPKQSIYASGVH
jgi:hypothetical protein